MPRTESSFRWSHLPRLLLRRSPKSTNRATRGVSKIGWIAQISKPVLLDLFCGLGGASLGYVQAGLEVIGVDIHPQPNYPYNFLHADVRKVSPDWIRQVADAVHASPPCQLFTPLAALPHAGVRNPPVNLIPPARRIVKASGLPYVIENVPRAPLNKPIRLCGTMFGLRLYRHRIFESNWQITEPEHPKHKALCMRAGYLPTAERPFMSIHGRGGHNSQAWVAKGAEYMEIPQARRDLDGLCESIPPAYTRYIGAELLRLLNE